MSSGMWRSPWKVELILRLKACARIGSPIIRLRIAGLSVLPKARTTATDRWLGTAQNLGNLYDVSRTVAAWMREPDPALAKKLKLTPNPEPDPIGSVSASEKRSRIHNANPAPSLLMKAKILAFIHSLTFGCFRDTASICHAAKTGDVAKIRVLLAADPRLVDAKNASGVSPLWLAAQEGHVEASKLLLEKGAVVDRQDSDGISSLWIAAQEGHLDTVKLLVEKGAALELKDRGGVTPLWIAVQEGHLAVVKLLVEKGAAVDTRNSEGATPLMYAAQEGRVEALKLLLEKGANPDAEMNGMTAVRIAREKGYLYLVGLLQEASTLAGGSDAASADSDAVQRESMPNNRPARSASKAAASATSTSASGSEARKMADALGMLSPGAVAAALDLGQKPTCTITVRGVITCVCMNSLPIDVEMTPGWSGGGPGVSCPDCGTRISIIGGFSDKTAIVVASIERTTRRYQSSAVSLILTGFSAEDKNADVESGPIEDEPSKPTSSVSVPQTPEGAASLAGANPADGMCDWISPSDARDHKSLQRAFMDKQFNSSYPAWSGLERLVAGLPEGWMRHVVWLNMGANCMSKKRWQEAARCYTLSLLEYYKYTDWSDGCSGAWSVAELAGIPELWERVSGSVSPDKAAALRARLQLRGREVNAGRELNWTAVSMLRDTFTDWPSKLSVVSQNPNRAKAIGFDPE